MTKKMKEEKSQALNAMQSPERFKQLEVGWIKDIFLGIEWGPSSDNYLTFKEAQKYCKELGGRLPEVHELHSLVDFTVCDPAINPIFKGTKSSYYWTATPVKRWPGERWVVGFYIGHVDINSEDDIGYARPVRASQ